MILHEQLCLYREDAGIAQPLEGLEIVDVGCGSGLACEVRLTCLTVESYFLGLARS